MAVVESTDALSATSGSMKTEDSILQAQVTEIEDTSLPLLQLVHQLLRNTSSGILQWLAEVSQDPNKLDGHSVDSQGSVTSLDLLLRFQRLLVAKLLSMEQHGVKAIAADPGTFVASTANRSCSTVLYS